jgi:nicotinamidase/pyrazinamidase
MSTKPILEDASTSSSFPKPSSPSNCKEFHPPVDNKKGIFAADYFSESKEVEAIASTYFKAFMEAHKGQEYVLVANLILLKLYEDNKTIADYFERGGLRIAHVRDIANKMQLGIIDLQNDFCQASFDAEGKIVTEQGSLAVPQSNEVFAPLNQFKKLFDGKTFITRDSHMPDDITFASHHKVDAFTMIDVNYPDFEEKKGMGACTKIQRNMVWPDHCIEGTKGCELSHLLALDGSEKVFRKGFGRRESYSAVEDTLGQPSTELPTMLDELDCSIVFVSGLARDYCAGGTAVDLAAKRGKIVFMLEDATKPVAEGSNAEMTQKMAKSGVKSIYISDVLAAMKSIKPDFNLDLL